MRRCVICKGGDVRPGRTSFTIERDDMTLVLKGVPAQVCDQCEEAYFDEGTTKKIETIADQAQRSGIHLAVQDYAA
jgi:YgiT-type zinc finger domain-containing protein